MTITLTLLQSSDAQFTTRGSTFTELWEGQMDTTSQAAVVNSAQLVTRARTNGSGGDSSGHLPAIGFSKNFGDFGNAKVVSVSARRVSCETVLYRVQYSTSPFWNAASPQRPDALRPVRFRFRDETVWVPKVQVISMPISSTDDESEYRVEYVPEMIQQFVLSVTVEVAGNLTTTQINQINLERNRVRTVISEKVILQDVDIRNGVISTGVNGFFITYVWVGEAGSVTFYDSDADIVTVPARDPFRRYRFIPGAGATLPSVVVETMPLINYSGEGVAPGTLPGSPISVIT